MTLSPLHSHFAAKHLTTPAHILQTKRESEIEKKTEKASARLNSAQSKWASPISGTLSDEALCDEQEKQEKLQRLEQRRGHLSEVLETETTKYQNELVANRQSARDKDRQVMSDEKSNDHWPSDNREFHSIEELRLDNFQVDHLSERLNEKRFDEHDRQEEERQTERQIRIVQLKIILQQQMNELKQKEEESQLFKQEEDALLREKHRLDQYQEERKQMDKPSVQQDTSRQLLRQHKAKLHKRAKEIQEQLEFNIKILTSIVHADEETALEQSEEREKFRRDASKMLEEFQEQMNLEKVREEELDGMYQDEAARQWSPREQEWIRENQAREKLIQRLLDQRQEQIPTRLQILKKQTQDTLEKQRTLIADMEQARKYHLIQKEKQAREREENRQVSIIQQERAQSPLDLQQHQIVQVDQKKQIDRSEEKQKSVISNTTVEPKFYGRRRVNWN